MNYSDRMKVYRNGLVLKDSMACSFQLLNGFAILSWTAGVTTTAQAASTATKIRANLHVPITNTSFPELTFLGRDYLFQLISPKGYASDVRWVLENKKINRTHITYLLRQA